MINILSASQIREADRFTIEHEPISSINLMERAAAKFTEVYTKNISPAIPVYCFCGYGNNGGDGLAISRMLLSKKYDVRTFILSDKKSYSEDFISNLSSLEKLNKESVTHLEHDSQFPYIDAGSIIVDALFGSGLNKTLEGLAQKLVEYLNKQDAIRIAVDVPSGLYADKPAEGTVFKAHHTITFQVQKLSFLFPENADLAGEVTVVDIGLDDEFIAKIPSSHFILEKADIRKIIRPRKKFDHKGKFGHSFIHAGSTGKMGAAILCATACAKSGAGLTTAHIPKENSSVLNVSIPEVMTEEYEISKGISKTKLDKYSALAFGPGIGTNASSKKILFGLLKNISTAVVLDADALTIISEDEKGWSFVPPNSILTPHPKEFERLAGKSNNWFNRLQKQLRLSKKQQVYIVLKGAYSCITTPAGMCYFNPTGNPGMAKGGSGDVLTGMIVSLLAQKYTPEQACMMGVYLHGLAADLAVKKDSEYSLLALGIIYSIGDAFRKILED